MQIPYLLVPLLLPPLRRAAPSLIPPKPAHTHRCSLRTQLLGAKRVLSVVVEQMGGFKRGSTARECVRVVLQAMRTFRWAD
jgi:hypothetical protein